MNLPAAHIEPLFFEPYVPEQEVSILQLKSKFEKLGVDEKKSQLLARYLVEPQNQVEVIYNENAKATQQEVIEILNDTIGHYFLYVDQEDKADDKKTAHKDMLSKMFVENFGRQRSSLIDEFNDMDFETQGVLKLEEVKYAIVTCDEDVDPKVLDYMIYYVFTRSKSAERMEYNVLIQLIDEHLHQKEKEQSAAKRSGPESSSPEKIKARNVGKKSSTSNSSSSKNGMGNQLELDEYSDDPDMQEQVPEQNSKGAAQLPDQKPQAEKPKELPEEDEE